MSFRTPARTRSGSRFASIAILALLAGCASLPPSLTPGLVGGRSIDGRLSVRYKDLATGKEDALSGTFRWTERDDDIELALLDPLGQSVALIRSSPSGSSLTFRDGRRVDGATPEALTREALGWTVPLRGLRTWLDGKPAAGAAASPLDGGGFREDNWTVRLQKAEGTDKPRRIDLSYPGPPAEIDLRLVVDRRDGG